LKSKVQTKRRFRLRWLWPIALLASITVVAILAIRSSVNNVMHPALDKLAAIDLSERWSHPEMLKIRELGDRAIPPLRGVLREQNSFATHFLTWVRTKWPGATNYYPDFPNPRKIEERQWTACQVLQTLGPAARAAAPELIDILVSPRTGNPNAASMALDAIGIDADICDRLDTAFGKAVAEGPRMQIVAMLGSSKPPSTRTIKVLLVAANDSSPWVQAQAVSSISRLGIGTPEAISALTELASKSTNELVGINAASALWEIKRDKQAVLEPVLAALQNVLLKPPRPGVPAASTDSGQGVDERDQAFMAAAELFQKMDLDDSQKARALALLQKWCDKHNRIFIRMLLLNSMMDLGLAPAQCLAVCEAGLRRGEEYYRLLAAQLLNQLDQKHPMESFNPDADLNSTDVGVRVNVAAIHWRRNHQAAVVVPVLIESLDRTKYQSYYYPQILPVALATLGDIGPDARAAIPVLERTAKDPNPGVARAATDALVKIRK
jgi:HEAT repeat protein